MQSRLSICIFVSSPQLAQSLAKLLSGDRYSLNQVYSPTELLDFVKEHTEQIDCLIVLNQPSLLPLLNQLHEQGILLPMIAIEGEESSNPKNGKPDRTTAERSEVATYLYHSGEVRLQEEKLEQIASWIDQAIAQFLDLEPSCTISEQPATTIEPSKGENNQTFLMLQQRRLAEKLKERLGYLGVYYKRNPQYFYRNLSQEEKQEFLEALSLDYRQILLNYFSKDDQINQTIDQFVNRAFFADISVSQILEMHMELIDEFAQMLKFEGRSEEILLDYRLTLIDIIAHLCEMYRRSIPREDLAL